MLAKLDHNLTANDRSSIHYGYWERVENRSFDGFAGAIQQGMLPHGERSHTFTLEETHTFTPNLLFNFRANVTDRTDYWLMGPGGFNPTTLGWSSSEVAKLGPSAASEFPNINLSEFANVGNTGNTQNVSPSLVLLPTVTWVKGKHTLRGGLDARIMQSVTDIAPGGTSFNLDRSWTQQQCSSCGSWDPSNGNSIASFLLGNPTSGSDSINVQTYWSSHYWASFVQDDWKLTRRLTLNLGFRWDIMPAETERHNLGDHAFNTKAVNPINSQVSIPGVNQIVAA